MFNSTTTPEALPKVDGQIIVRWFWSPGKPIRNNVRLMVRDGVLEDVEEADSVPSSAVLPVLCLPPLVNPHTHLEFSDLQQPLGPHSPFPDWIDSVITHRAQAPPDPASMFDVIERGISESEQAGVFGIGEIATRSDTLTTFARRNVRTRIFREYLGLSPERSRLCLEDAGQFISSVRTAGCKRILPGLSPHAPYSVSEELFQGLIELALFEDLPLSMHLAETRDECDLLRTGRGTFRSFLERRGLWRENQFPGNKSVLPFLEAMSKLSSSLAVHCNYLDDSEIRFLGDNPQIRVVYCPRTHAYFQHDAHPWLSILKAGGRILLGTDSRASNPSLSLWQELLHVVRNIYRTGTPEFPDLASLLSMVTVEAAESLGFSKEEFSQQTGHDWNAVLIGINGDCTDLTSALLYHDSTPIAVVSAGVHRPLSSDVSGIRKPS